MIPSPRGAGEKANTSNPASCSSWSGRAPRNKTSRPSTRPPSRIALRMLAEYVACVAYSAPMRTNRASGTRNRTWVNAVTSSRMPFCGLMLATHPTTGASSGQPHPARTYARVSGRGRNSSTSTGGKKTTRRSRTDPMPGWESATSWPVDITASANVRTKTMDVAATGHGALVSRSCHTTGTCSSLAAIAACGLTKPPIWTRSMFRLRIRFRIERISDPKAITWPRCTRGSGTARKWWRGRVATSMPPADSRSTAFPGSSGSSTEVSQP